MPNDKNTDNQGKKDYEVGYGKPPKQHQWKKGQSGNPLGYRHPKTKKQFESLLDEVFSEEISAKLPGKSRKQKMARLRAAIIKVLDSGNEHGLEYFIDKRYGKTPSTVDVTIPTIFTQINFDSLPIELLDKIIKGDASVLSDLLGNRQLIEGSATDINVSDEESSDEDKN